MPQRTTRNERIERMYIKGKSLRQIAAKFEVSHNRIWQILRARGVPLRPRGARTKEFYRAKLRA